MVRGEYGSIGIMQPYFFPYLGYFQLINAVEHFILYDQIDYIKGSWINRNRLLEVGQCPFYITVPLRHGGRSGNKISEMSIVDNGWRQRMLRTIFFNYKRSPFFEEVYRMIEDVINFNTSSLSELNKFCISRVSEYLGINTKIEQNPDYSWLEIGIEHGHFDSIKHDLGINLNLPSTKLLRCIAICKDLGTNSYINLIGGMTLYPKEEFRNNSIHIDFLEMNDLSYTQRSDDFFSNLSIIDVLMNVGRFQTIKFLEQYTLK